MLVFDWCNPSRLHASIDAPRWAMGIRIVVRRRPAQRWHVPSAARAPANIGLDPDVKNCRFTACERGFDLFANILRAFYPYPACPHGLSEQCEVGAQQFTGPCRSKARRELATLAEKPICISRIETNPLLFQTTQTTGRSYSTAVATVLACIRNPPSPTTARTGLPWGRELRAQSAADSEPHCGKAARLQ